jgi:hypothetical protein
MEPGRPEAENLETKRAMLEELAKQAKSGKKAAKPASDKDKESEGYLTKFLNTVVDNISIYLNNVHLRCVRGPCRRPRTMPTPTPTRHDHEASSSR